MTTFSEEEKQQIMSEELYVIQQEIASINEINSSNREKMDIISNLDKEVRSKLALRSLDLNPDKYISNNNKHLIYSSTKLSLATAYALKEKSNKQSISMQKINRTLEIASLSTNDFKAQEAKTPIGYPCPGYIDPGFGWRTHPIYRIPDYHKGVDISASYGYGLKATGDGIVTAAGWAGGYGYRVTVYHRDGISTLYGHCLEGLLVKVGDHVKRGQIIAKAGATGDATCPHVHYEVIRENTPVDPEVFNQDIKRMSRTLGR